MTDISEVARPLLPVAGYPQLTVVSPTIEDLAQCEERTAGMETGDTDQLAKVALWFFNQYVRDADGAAVTGVKTVKDARQKVPTSLLRAAMNAFNAGAGALSDDPPDAGAAES